MWRNVPLIPLPYRHSDRKTEKNSEEPHHVIYSGHLRFPKCEAKVTLFLHSLEMPAGGGETHHEMTVDPTLGTVPVTNKDPISLSLVQDR